ncbi:MAG: hypothetical protein L3K08_04550 [Thermoplasmata archaeon]|nr:hypothetical protein [Thermoplasmata archaeon]
MEELAPSVRRRRYRRLRGRRAVVSVIGTLLALLVFFALFGIFLTQYVPLWMEDNESAWTSQIQASFATLKSNMDLQVTLGSSGLLATPFVMSSQGIPLIAQPTEGVMSFVPNTAGVFANVSATHGPGGSGPFYQNVSLGVLRLQEPNRYFPQQIFELEDDAVVQAQSDTHEIIAFPPPLTLNVSGTQVGATVVLYQMIGNATQAISTGSEQVYSQFVGAQSFEVVKNGPTFNAKVALGTHFECGWQAFFNQTAHTAGLPSGTATVSPGNCVPSLSVAQDVTLTLTGLTSLDLIVANFQIIIGVGVE